MPALHLERFIEAQAGVYRAALSEIKNGQKTGHWMWYVFPQLKGLGRSQQSAFYGIDYLDEACAYLKHNILGTRLKEICCVLLDLPGNDAVAVFGRTDAMKLHSSMTLFSKAYSHLYSRDDPNVFLAVLEKYFGGRECEYTARHYHFAQAGSEKPE